ncbi:hypothetical protein [Rhodococcus chondri]|uniref:DUF2207 domain-containing protein n=1 Tax=Rhodococcus chondri TaxID=3065941 RepID=A0ABU7JM01_9NOCA|nr:hypothetical protein [Rhodococcus sp. CC-R104]MEE2031069.1 hypothetical protein [Rhodococcus sp. CC-R104]
MFWKIVGMVALVWVALAVIGALFDHLFGILVLSAVIFGGYLLYKAIAGSDKHDDITRI